MPSIKLIEVDKHRVDDIIDSSSAAYHQILLQNCTVNTLEDAITMTRMIVYERFLNDECRAAHRFCDIVDIDTGLTVGSVWYTSKFKNANQEIVGRICVLEVKPEYRRQGYARAALNFIERTLTEMEVQALSLNVFADNEAARSLYASCGYEILSETSNKREMQKPLAKPAPKLAAVLASAPAAPADAMLHNDTPAHT